MWPNNNNGNSFGGNGSFHNGFNQDDFSPSPIGNSAATPLGGQPIFTQLPFNTSSGEGFQNGYIPDLSMFNNQTAFQQTQFMHPLPVCAVELDCSPSSRIPISHTRCSSHIAKHVQLVLPAFRTPKSTSTSPNP